LKAGAAVVTGGGDLAASFVLHVVLRDPDSGIGREVVRRALQSAWQRATDWELGIIAAPLVGADAGQLSLEEAATLLVETFPPGPGGCPLELHIVVGQDAEREQVEAIVRRIA
jgi:O-acetyl-ADP-ribose deacetylase (regulator of RNase III)